VGRRKKQNAMETDVTSVIHREREIAAAFRKIWTLFALHTVDADLYDLLREQYRLFNDALFVGDYEEIQEQGEAMCRGWAIAIQRMAVAQVQELWPGAKVVAVRSKSIQGDGEC
jgi:hypothetical protein